MDADPLQLRDILLSLERLEARLGNLEKRLEIIPSFRVELKLKLKPTPIE
jgi:hypothetical protein